MAFTPVALERVRSNGWSALQQERFIRALAEMGTVGFAAKAVGMTPKSAYRLRERPGAESFASAWDAALDLGRGRQYDVAMERAMEGVTTITVRRGGSVAINAGPDVRLMNAVMRATPPENALKSQRSQFRGEYGGPL